MIKRLIPIKNKLGLMYLEFFKDENEVNLLDTDKRILGTFDFWVMNSENIYNLIYMKSVGDLNCLSFFKTYIYSNSKKGLVDEFNAYWDTKYQKYESICKKQEGAIFRIGRTHFMLDY
jgi:hypothetical protein